jgi:simple sugar transport system permease protein
MRPRGVIILTMTLCGLFAGLAGTTEILGKVGHMEASYAPGLGFTAIAVALLGRAHPVGILFAALLFGAMQAGANDMQIQAGMPVQMVDLLQAVILFFITADIVVRRIFRVRDRAGEIVELASVSRSYGGGGTG